MKKLFIGIAAILGVISVALFAADLTAPVNTPSGQLYNQLFRDNKDGNNSQTVDHVSANTYAAVGVTTTIKTSGGYLDNIQLFQACQNTYKIIDSTFVSGDNNYATVIATIPVSYTVMNMPMHIRFLNGLTWTNPISSCTATVSYR